MSRLTEGNNIIPYPIPYMGIDWSVPFTEVQHPYCPMMRDFTANGESVQIFRGYTQLNTYGSNGAIGLKVPVSSTLMLIKNPFDTSNCYTVNTSSLAITSIVSAPSAALAALSWQDYCDYEDRTFIYTKDGDVYSYNSGTIASAFTITRPPSATAGSMTVYRDRLVVAEQKTLYYVSTVGAVSGSFASLALDSVIGDTYLTSIRALSNVGSDKLQDSLVLSCANGKILIYSGDYPGSANWQLASIIPTSQSTDDVINRKLVQVPGDIYFFDGKSCTALSIRRILESGVAAAVEENPLGKISKFLNANFYEVLSPIYHANFNRILFIVAKGSSSNAISEKDFLQTNYARDHFVFSVDLTNYAISLYTPPANGSSVTASDYYRLIEDDNKALVVARDGNIYISTYTTDLYRVLDPDGFYTEINIPNLTIYPTVYMPYTDLSLSSIKNITMAHIACSVEEDFDFSLYLDFDFAKRLITNSEMTEFKYVDSDNGSKLVHLPVSGTGNYVAPCLQTRFKSKFALNRITLQIQDGGPY